MQETLDVLNKRCLLDTSKYGHSTEEYKILEFSPSKQWVRLMDQHGTKRWLKSSGVNLVETLEDIEKRPKS